ncbi:hypothetical protein Tco_0447717, partial [Tanacetum coccineum]
MDTAYRQSGRSPVFIFTTVYTAYSLNEYSVYRTFEKLSTKLVKVQSEVLKSWNFKTAVQHTILLNKATWRITT